MGLVMCPQQHAALNKRAMCRTQLAELIRFSSSQSGEEETSLKDYVGRMKPGQQGIFFISADSKLSAESSPFVEKLQKRGFEVRPAWGPVQREWEMSKDRKTTTG